MSVLTNGKPHGSNVDLKPSDGFGGQTPPVTALRSTMPTTCVELSSVQTPAGNSDTSKYAQNQATKNITSEAMNMIMP